MSIMANIGGRAPRPPTLLLPDTNDDDDGSPLTYSAPLGPPIREEQLVGPPTDDVDEDEETAIVDNDDVITPETVPEVGLLPVPVNAMATLEAAPSPLVILLPSSAILPTSDEGNLFGTGRKCVLGSSCWWCCRMKGWSNCCWW